MAKLQSDIDVATSKKVFSLLAKDTNIFNGCSEQEVEGMMTILKVVSFDKGDQIVKSGEPIDMFCIVILGELRVGMESSLTPEQEKEGRKMHYLKLGDMIGHQNLSEQCVATYTDEMKWKFDLIAEQKGYMAVFPFSEVKIEIRKNPKQLFKLL